MRPEAAVERLFAQAYTIPTDSPEADGTASWDVTTIVVHAEAAGQQGMGDGLTLKRQDADPFAIWAGVRE